MEATVPGVDLEIAKFFATLGVGGAIAGIMFLFYRKDVSQFTDLWKTQTELLIEVVTKNTEAHTRADATNARLAAAVAAFERDLADSRRAHQAERGRRDHPDRS